MIKEFFQSALKPQELNALLQLKKDAKFMANRDIDLSKAAQTMPDREFCYVALNKVSRSFAIVIRQLPTDLRDAVCIFYLVLRALDTIEDDMSYPKSLKQNLLRSFYKKSYDTGWSVKGIGDSEDYRILLENYHKVSRTFLALKPDYQKTISTYCQKMGEGMADFSNDAISTKEDFDHYCHYVAGLVGIGLSGIFSASGLERADLKNETELSNSMGLFLQKTNIIRDFKEDFDADRIFWPSAVWQKHTNALSHLSKHPKSASAINCLNEMIADALRHTKDCLLYLSELQDLQVFRFCAIPQVMAVATLAKLQGNPRVFMENVKVRKGLTAKYMVNMANIDDVFDAFERAFAEILRNSKPSQASHKMALKNINDARKFIVDFSKNSTSNNNRKDKNMRLKQLNEKSFQ